MKLLELQKYLKKNKLDGTLLFFKDPNFFYFVQTNIEDSFLFLPTTGKPTLFTSSLENVKTSYKKISYKNPYVDLKVFFTKNNIKTQQSCLCEICNTLMVVCKDVPKYMMLGPIIGNKIVLRDFQLTQVFSDEFPERDRIRERISFEITNHAIMLRKNILFEFDEYTKDHELGFPTFYLRTSQEATDVYNEFNS